MRNPWSFAALLQYMLHLHHFQYLSNSRLKITAKNVKFPISNYKKRTPDIPLLLFISAASIYIRPFHHFLFAIPPLTHSPSGESSG